MSHFYYCITSYDCFQFRIHLKYASPYLWRQWLTCKKAKIKIKKKKKKKKNLKKIESQAQDYTLWTWVALNKCWGSSFSNLSSSVLKILKIMLLTLLPGCGEWLVLKPQRQRYNKQEWNSTEAPVARRPQTTPSYITCPFVSSNPILKDNICSCLYKWNSHQKLQVLLLWNNLPRRFSVCNKGIWASQVSRGEL